MRAFSLVMLLALLLSGCVAPGALDGASAPGAGAARIVLTDAPGGVVATGAPFTWNGSGLTPPASSSADLACSFVFCPAGAPVECGRSNCARRAFTLEGASPARVVLAVQPENENGFFTARIADARGKVIAEAEPGEYAQVAVADALPPGAYEAQVMSAGARTRSSRRSTWRVRPLRRRRTPRATFCRTSSR